MTKTVTVPKYKKAAKGMQPVHFAGKVIGYVSPKDNGLYHMARDARKRKVTWSFSKAGAVKALIRHHLQVDAMVDNMTERALARMSRKKLPPKLNPLQPD